MTEAIFEDSRHGFAPAPVEAGRLVALLLPLALLGGALGSQYIGGLVPCEMCYWQRWPHAAAIALALFAFTAPAPSWRSRAATLLAAAAIAASGAIGAWHAGIELGIFEGVTTCSTTVTAATSTADLFDQIVNTPLVRCDQVQWAFLGVSMAGWNAIVSLGGALLVAVLTLGARK